MTTDTAAQADDRARPSAPFWLTWLQTRGAWILLLDLALVAVFTALSPGHVFWSVANAQALLLGMSQTLLLALGLAMMLGAGIFDLSLGANLVLFIGVGARRCTRSRPPLVMRRRTAPLPLRSSSAWLLRCGGVRFGLVNGLLIAYGQINSLIATLGTMGIGTGLALLLSGGTDLGGLPVALQTDFGLRSVGPIPIPALVALVIASILWGPFAIPATACACAPSAPSALRPSAPASAPVGTCSRSTVLGGALAGLAGFIDLSRFGATAINGHANDALGAVTAAVIGGTLLEGGHISITGTIWGAALAVILAVRSRHPRRLCLLATHRRRHRAGPRRSARPRDNRPPQELRVLTPD